MHVLHNRLVTPGAELADGCRLGSAFRRGLVSHGRVSRDLR
jgi:hypothetical protein